MTLREALEDCETVGAVPDVEITGLDYDSRCIEPGFAFFAFPGERVDGHRFIPAARQAGAAAVVSERPRPEDDPGHWVQVRHGRRALACAALAFYGRPDRRIKIVAVTGHERQDDDGLSDRCHAAGGGILDGSAGNDRAPCGRPRDSGGQYDA